MVQGAVYLIRVDEAEDSLLEQPIFRRVRRPSAQAVAQDRLLALSAIRRRSTSWVLSCHSMCSWSTTSSLPPNLWIRWHSWHRRGRRTRVRIASPPRPIQGDRLSRGSLRRCGVCSYARFSAQSASLSDGARTARIAAIAFPPIRDRARAVCGKLCVCAVRSAVHAAVRRHAVPDRRGAGLCAGRAISPHRHPLRADCNDQPCADHQGRRQQAKVRRAAARANGQAQDHQKRLGGEHLAGALC